MSRGAVNIPYPGDDVVVYSWPAGGGSFSGAYWERRRQSALNKADEVRLDYDDNTPELLQLARKVIQYGMAEREKEIALLEEYLPDADFTRGTHGKTGSVEYELYLIEQLSGLISGRKQYENALTRIKIAMQMGETTAKTTGEAFKGLGPSIASTFTSYLTTELTKIFKEFVQTVDISDPYAKWEGYINSRIDEAIDNAMEQMLEKSTARKKRDKIYGDSRQWKAIGEAYRLLKPLADDFRGMIKEKIDFTNLVEAFNPDKQPQILDKALAGNLDRSGFYTFVSGSQGLNLEARQASIGGSVEEFLRTFITNIAPKGGTITEKSTKVIKGEKVTTDTVTVMSTNRDVTLDTAKLANMISDTLTEANSKQDAARRLAEFYDNNLKNLDDNFIIYTNTKNYSLGAGFSGFHNGRKMLLERLVDYIDMANIPADKATAFIHTAYNAMPTAIYNDELTEIKDNIRYILSSAAARLLFDDWATIGVENSGAQQLHVFDLDGITVPSSFIFIKLGLAMENAAMKSTKFQSSYFSVSVQTPKEPIYKEGEWKQAIGYTDEMTNEEVKHAIYDKWNEQYEQARKQFTFSVKFLINFKSLMKELIRIGDNIV